MLTPIFLFRFDIFKPCYTRIMYTKYDLLPRSFTSETTNGSRSFGRVPKPQAPENSRSTGVGSRWQVSVLKTCDKKCAAWIPPLSVAVTDRKSQLPNFVVVSCTFAAAHTDCICTRATCTFQRQHYLRSCKNGRKFLHWWNQLCSDKRFSCLDGC